MEPSHKEEAWIHIFAVAWSKYCSRDCSVVILCCWFIKNIWLFTVSGVCAGTGVSVSSVHHLLCYSSSILTVTEISKNLCELLLPLPRESGQAWTHRLCKVIQSLLSRIMGIWHGIGHLLLPRVVFWTNSGWFTGLKTCWNVMGLTGGSYPLCAWVMETNTLLLLLFFWLLQPTVSLSDKHPANKNVSAFLSGNYTVIWWIWDKTLLT